MHFVPLAVVYAQPLTLAAAIGVTMAAIAALVLPRRGLAPSFWCGILAGPVFAVVGATALIAGRAALGN